MEIAHNEKWFQFNITFFCWNHKTSFKKNLGDCSMQKVDFAWQNDISQLSKAFQVVTR